MAVFRDDVLAGRVALVTGGGSGIGAAIARTLARHGAKVAVCGRKQDKLDRVAAEIDAHATHGATSEDRCLAMTADVRQPEALAALMGAIDARWGRLDVVVNSAAGNFLCPATQLSPNGFGTVVDIDLKGTFHSCRAAFDLLSRQGGSIVNVSATLQYTGTPWQAHAAAAKAGIDALTRTLAVEWGPAHIRVNAVAPGPIDGTEGMAKLAPGDVKDKVTRLIPLGRFGTCDEVADAVLFLSSDASRWTTGAILVVDGGQWLASSGLGLALQ